ncbi:MAG: AAA family ATPase [Patescibacteria group bacterium]
MNPVVATLQKLKASLEANKGIPQDLRMKAYEQIARAALSIQFSGNTSSIEMTEKYISFLCKLPWGVYSQDTLNLDHAKEIMESHHYGLPKVKERVLQFLASIALIKKKNPNATLRAPSLFFVGLAGTGKTTFAKIIAESLGRKFYRIPFGGLANALDLRGQSKITPYATPGVIMRAVAACGTSNPVILLDELDRVNPDDRSAIMGAMLEILDPGQNDHFSDYFVDYPYDLSKVMFVATANNTRDISTAVLDRLEVIQMPSYNDDEKMMIGKRFVLPEKLSFSGLDATQFSIDDAVWPKLVRPLGFEPGIRSLERVIDSMVRQAALDIVSGKYQTLKITENNLHDYVDTTFSSVQG